MTPLRRRADSVCRSSEPTVTRYLTLLVGFVGLLAIALQYQRDGRTMVFAASALEEPLLPVLGAAPGISADTLTWFRWSPDEAPVIVPVRWTEFAYAMMDCESGRNPDAVGLQGERGMLQLHPSKFATMREYGYDPEKEPDRIAYAISLWGWSGETWRYHWRHCAKEVGAP